MKQKIMILNVCRYTNKTTKMINTSFQYVLMDATAIADNDNYKGASVLSMFLQADLINQISPLMLQQTEMEIEYQYNSKNPMKPNVVVKSITGKNGTSINLAQ